jgi:hypothetical protein
MKKIKKESQSVSGWQVVSGARLESLLLSFVWRRFGRSAGEAVRFWRACGSPVQFRPRRSLRRLAFLRFVALVVCGVRLVLVFAFLFLLPWLVALLVGR